MCTRKCVSTYIYMSVRVWAGNLEASVQIILVNTIREQFAQKCVYILCLKDTYMHISREAGSCSARRRIISHGARIHTYRIRNDPSARKPQLERKCIAKGHLRSNC